MKFISVKSFGPSSTTILKTLTEEREMVVTNNGKPVALLTLLNDENFEHTLASIRQAKAINAVNLIQRQSVENGTDNTTMEEIDEEIRRIRKESQK
jgi:hypothetical protein